VEESAQFRILHSEHPGPGVDFVKL
jgi:hypothetical protein